MEQACCAPLFRAKPLRIGQLWRRKREPRVQKVSHNTEHPRSQCLTIRRQCHRYSIGLNVWLTACLGSWVPPVTPPSSPPNRMVHGPSKDSPGPTQAEYTKTLHHASLLFASAVMRNIAGPHSWNIGAEVTATRARQKGICHAELSNSIRIRVRFALSASMQGAPAEGPELGESKALGLDQA